MYNKKSILVSSGLVLTLLLTGCGNDNKNEKPADIKTNKIENKSTEEKPTVEIPVQKAEVKTEEKKSNQKEQKVDVNKVFETVKSMHNYKADDINLYSKFKNELKDQNIKIEGDLSTPYTQFYNKTFKRFEFVRVGHLLDYETKIKNKDKNIVDFYIQTVNAKAAIPSGYSAQETGTKALKIIKNNPQSVDASQIIHYQLVLNKDKTSGILKIDPKDKNWYKRINN